MYFEKGKRSKLLFILLTALFAQPGFSTTQSYFHKPVFNKHAFSNWYNTNLAPLLTHYVITVSGWQGWETTDSKQTLFLTPSIEKSFVTNPSVYAFGSGEIFAGVYQPVNKIWEWQLGLALGTYGNTRILGNIWDDGNEQFNNYAFSYMVRSTHITVKGKLLADIGMLLIPWVSGSLGVGFNQAHEFQSNPLIFQAEPMPSFASNTTVACTWSLGIGAQANITTHWQAGIGYEFADWGKSQLGRAPGQSVGTGPVLNHLLSSSVLLNLSYLA